MSDKISPIQPSGFRSLVELQDAHDQLLDRRDQLADSELGTPEFWQEVSEFAKNAQATGVWLDASRDRRAGQSILDYWTNALFRAGQAIPAERLAEFDPRLAPELPDEPCPYQGLAAFDEGRGSFYFGRESLVVEMIRRLANGARLLAITGASGSGKSSVVLAGMLPALKAGALAGSRGWRYIVMVPGSNPVANLEYALRSVKDGSLSAPLMLVVDQFEEAFTLCQDEPLTAEFVARLLRLLDSDQSDQPPATITLTMRSDFVDRVARTPELWTRFRSVRLEVEALDINELRAAIEGPAATVGLKFEEGIVDDLISTILGERAGLPLLQFTLLRLWEKRQRNRVTYTVYQQVGNPRQALERSAEEFYIGLFPEEQVTVRRILLKMVRPGPGLEVTSNRIRRSELFHNAEAHDRVEHVLDRLINDVRLVKLSMRESSEDEQVEVAHEALIRNWPRLVQWLDEEREELRQRFLLAEAARQWEQQGRPSDGLWRGRLLDEAHDFADLSDLEREFLAASDEQVRLEREQGIAQQVELSWARERAIQQTRRVRRLRWLVIVLIILALIPTILILIDLQLRESPWLSVENMPPNDVTAVAFSDGKDPSENLRYCVGTLELGVACSIDGITWNIYQQGLPTGGLENAPATSLRGVNALAIDRTNPDKIFVFNWGKGVSKSESGGMTWEATGLTLPDDGVSRMAVYDNWVAAVIQNSISREENLYLSGDGGTQWNPLSRSSGGPMGEIHDVDFVNASGPSPAVNMIVAAEDGLYRGETNPADSSWSWERLADVASIRLVAVGDSLADGVFFTARNSEQTKNELYAWRFGAKTKPIASFKQPIRALSARIVGPNQGTAYLLLDSEEVFAVSVEGKRISLRKPPTSLIDLYSDESPYGYDLAVVPNPEGDGEWLLLGSSDGLLYQPVP